MQIEKRGGFLFLPAENINPKRLIQSKDHAVVLYIVFYLTSCNVALLYVKSEYKHNVCQILLLCMSELRKHNIFLYAHHTYMCEFYILLSTFRNNYY